MKIALDPYRFRTTALLEPSALVATLDRLGLDGVMTSCVFAWEDRARQSTLFTREQIARHMSAWGPCP